MKKAKKKIKIDTGYRDSNDKKLCKGDLIKYFDKDGYLLRGEIIWHDSLKRWRIHCEPHGQFHYGFAKNLKDLADKEQLIKVSRKIWLGPLRKQCRPRKTTRR